MVDKDLALSRHYLLLHVDRVDISGHTPGSLHSLGKAQLHTLDISLSFLPQCTSIPAESPQKAERGRHSYCRSPGPYLCHCNNGGENSVVCSDTVTSNHYGTVTTLVDVIPAQRPQHIPKWKTDKASWQAFQKGLAHSPRDNEPQNNENVDVLGAKLV